MLYYMSVLVYNMGGDIDNVPINTTTITTTTTTTTNTNTNLKVNFEIYIADRKATTCI